MTSKTTMRTQHEIWNDLVGDAWVRHAALHEQQAAPFGEAAIAAVGAVQGATVLDVGCGTGATTGSLAARGAHHVFGIDLSVPMISAARAGNRRPNVRFEVGDVLDLTMTASYDIVFSRFGVMFFTDPVAAFGHLRALAHPDARLGFCCWGPPADNPWMTLPVMATSRVLGPPTAAGPGEPGPFSLSSPDVVGDVLNRAGWREVDVDKLCIIQPHPAGDAAAVARVVVEFSPLIVERLRQQHEHLDEVIDAITEALGPFERDGIVHLPASAHIVTAHA